jgi:urease accessory protein
LSAGARLAWLPQETILFNGVRLARRLDVELDASASALLFEATAFGRAAAAERLDEGRYEDRWFVRRGGRLVYADALRLQGPISNLLERPAVAAGARALATLLYVAPDAEARLDEARALLDGSDCECGASAWSGILAARWLGATIEPLRRDVARFITAFRGAPMPRVWTL